MPEAECTEQELKLLRQLEQTDMTKEEIVGALSFAYQKGVLEKLSKIMEEYKLTDPSHIFRAIRLLAEE